MKYVNFPLVCFIAFSIKLIIKDSSVTDSVALAAIASLYGFSLFLEKKYQKQPDINEELKKELELIKSAVGSIKLAQSQNRR